MILSSYPRISDPFKQGEHIGLNFYYGIGSVRADNIVTDVAAGTLLLTDNATNYIEITTIGVISTNVVGFTIGKIPLYIVVALSGAIAAITDKRCFLSVGGGSSIVVVNDLITGGTTNALSAEQGKILSTQINDFVNYVVPACRVYNNTSISIPSATPTTLPFNSERFDTDNIHDIATNNSRLTCKTVGKYLISANAVIPAISAATQLRIMLNGVKRIAMLNMSSPTAPTLSVSTIYELNVNDYVEVVVYHDKGISLDVTYNEQYSPEFMMVKVG